MVWEPAHGENCVSAANAKKVVFSLDAISIGLRSGFPRECPRFFRLSDLGRFRRLAQAFRPNVNGSPIETRLVLLAGHLHGIRNGFTSFYRVRVRRIERGELTGAGHWPKHVPLPQGGSNKTKVEIL